MKLFIHLLLQIYRQVTLLTHLHIPLITLQITLHTLPTTQNPKTPKPLSWVESTRFI